MYLKRLEIQGFKSFADKVDIDFNSGITVVVGPNGSGKSNVVDAIRWVLGEQSAKTLRGLRMDDIIFSGSNNRRPVGMAQVSLTLDNSAGIFPLDYQEVTVTRRLYRSGESEYLINKVPCRMKDIHQLFMDTGVGKEGFSVIGQGKVDEILSLKAEERRNLIEEAAGIVKYRYRKKETERKLADTEQSLVRVNDIVHELSQQLGPLEEQAGKAKQYQNWKKELDQLEISLAIHDIEENQGKEKEFKGLIEQLEKELEETNTQYHQLSSQIENLKFENQQLDNSISHHQQEYYDLNSELERKEHQIQISLERQKNIDNQIDRIEADLNNTVMQKRIVGDEIAKKKEELAKIESDYLEVASLLKEINDAINKYKVNLVDSNALLEDYKGQIIENLQQKANKSNELNKLENELNHSTRRKQQLQEKVASIQNSLLEMANNNGEIAKEYKYLLNEKKQHEDLLAAQQKNIQDNVRKQDLLRKKMETKQLQFQKLRSRYAVIEEMEETGEGYQRGVRAIVEEIRKKTGRIEGIIGTVADITTVPKEIEVAVETALGGALQHLIAEEDRFAQAAINFLKKEKKGRATFLPLNTITSRANKIKLDSPSVIGRAVDLIGFDKKYQQVMDYLLGRVWIIKDLKSAVNIGKDKGFNIKMVTLEGEIITPGGALTGGTFNNNKTGLLARKRLLKELSQQILHLEVELNSLSGELNSLEQENKKILLDIDEKREKIHQQQIKISEVNNRKEQMLKDIKRLEDEKRLLEMEREEIEAEVSLNQAARERLLKEEQLLMEKNKDVEQEIANLQSNLKEITARQEGLIESLNEQKIKEATLKRSFDLIKEQLNGQEKRLFEIAEIERNLGKEKGILEQEKDQLIITIAKCREDIKNYREKLQQMQITIEQEKEKRNLLQENLAFAESEIKLKQNAIDRLRGEIYQNNMKLTKIQMEIKRCQDKLLEQFGYSLEEAVNYKLDLVNKRDFNRRIKELKESINDLGLVNFASITEFERVTQRLDFLSKQLTDLEEAKISLLKVIKEMDTIMVKKFKETFALVNEAFNSVFTDMFGGGRASLELSDQDNLLDTGIEIIAQPPGKKAQTLSLLSGGERAMTAIALLFAILRVKPSPFCVLDEIEAALDEANVNRFASFLKFYVDKTQFIIISHRKGTMEAADVLYGVTIEENGVSKLISVKLNEAV